MKNEQDESIQPDMPQEVNTEIHKQTRVDTNLQNPQPSNVNQLKKSNKARLIIPAVIGFITIVGVVISVVVNKNENIQNLKDENQSLLEKQQAKDNQPTEQQVQTVLETAEESVSSPAFVLQEPSDKAILYDVDFGDSTSYESATIDKSRYVTIDIPSDWKVYEQPLDSAAAELGGLRIHTNSGKYIHLSRVDGVGGDCPENDTSYTLIKKLATKVPNKYFTQYKIDNGVDYFELETLYPGADGYMRSQYEKHAILKEGDSNTNSCNTSGYSFVNGKIYVTLSSSYQLSLGGNLSWDQVKDDEQFVSALQSLSSFGYGE